MLDALEVDAAHVYGYSMGGRTALSLAAAHPGRVRSLVLVGATAGLATAEARAERVEGSLLPAEERDAGDEAATTHGHENGVDLAFCLLENLEPDGALAGDHIRIVEGVHIGHPLLLHQFRRVRGGLASVGRVIRLFRSSSVTAR